MFKTIVLPLLCLFVTMASPFPWDFVVGGEKKLYFYYNETIQHIEELPMVTQITSLTYDTVHNRVLFSDVNDTMLSIFDFNLSTRKIKTVLSKKTSDPYARIVYDPVTQLLVWKERHNIHTFFLKPASFKTAVDVKIIVTIDRFCRDVAVDSCGGYIYWLTDANIERARLDGSDREIILDNTAPLRTSLAIDQQTQRIYWIERTILTTLEHQDSIKSSDFNGKNQATLHVEKKSYVYISSSMAVSKDFIYWKDHHKAETWQLPKNSSDHVVKKLSTNSSSDWSYQLVAANYTIQEQIQGIKSCHALQRLIHNNTKPASTVASCQNYCLEGDCSFNAGGQPTCRCKTGYTGERCEVNTCQSYCLNGGTCSINEKGQPACRCSEDYEGNRCEFPAYFIKCIQTVAMLKDVLSADLPPNTLNIAVKSTCASTVV